MVYFIIILILLLAILGPQHWSKHILDKYAEPQPHIPGTGGELARHLLDRLGMSHVKVEIAGEGEDHYDPREKAVRLSPRFFEQNSLSAVAVAAHEVGHAIQDHHGEALLNLRNRLAVFAHQAQKIGAIAMLGIPVIAMLTRSPGAGGLMLLIGVASMLTGVILHLVTLPVEIDASFGKALPLLSEGYIRKEEQAAVKKILRAAALTYLAASLNSLLNLWRWIAILRR